MLWTAPPTGRASALESVADEATSFRVTEGGADVIVCRFEVC